MLAPFHKNHAHGPHHQGDKHGGRPEQIFLDQGVEQEAHHAGGQRGEDQQPDAAHAREAHVGLRLDQAPEAFPVQHHHGHNGPELNHNLKGGGPLSYKIKQIAHKNQMPRGGDRQKFSQAFHDAQNKGGEQIIHIGSPGGPPRCAAVRCFSIRPWHSRLQRGIAKKPRRGYLTEKVRIPRCRPSCPRANLCAKLLPI